MIVVTIIALIAAIAIPSMIRSRMSANEINAAAACKEFATAEEIYHRTDYAQVGFLTYAQHLKGNNSLLETSAGLSDLGLIDVTFANAEGAPGTVPPKAGYVFTVLTAQGASAEGGVTNYVANGYMTVGYAFCASPASYDTSGRNTFVVSSDGTTYQKDKGDNVLESVYNPDSTWTPAE
jgi:type II secretory pathway pseudopilin PulG